jgi:hypothetical protein
MKTIRVIVASFFILCFVSCKKVEKRGCIKTVGAEQVKDIDLPFFNKLQLYERIKFELVQDSVNKVILRGGKNLLTKIDLRISEDTLIINNNNKCNFLRNYSKIVTAEIHFKELIELKYFGTETLTNKGVLNLPWFALSILSSSGSVDLNLNSNVIYASSGNYGDFNLSGKTNFAFFDINSNGYCNTSNLLVKDSIKVSSRTMGIMKVNADNTLLNVEIKNGGNVFYKGTPSSILLKKTGKGELIKE